ncbi:MAG TPA: Na/Pi symporter [Acidimicrobiia bacterium]|nr:Na/Pi symporter [Acidimicrobiia bacterium]
MGERSRSDEVQERGRLVSWGGTAGRLALALLFLYLFLVGVKALEKGISSFGGEVVGEVFGSVANPIAGLAAGVLATVLVQSSSVTTSMMVGLVGAGVLPLETAVPMVMGANIGTTVTNTLASLGHVRQNAYFERAFAAATVHDYFNLLSVAILLPIEIGFGLVTSVATWLSDLLGGLLPAVESGDGRVKQAVEAPVDWFAGQVEQLGGNPGVPLLVLGICLIFFALWVITRQMKSVMSGRIENAINGILGRGAGVGALIAGMLMTAAVQSSSITTSILVPLVAAGVLSLRNAYPVTLGANIGTTVTALLASVAADSPDALTLAMAHLTFNVLGTLIFYPAPRLRDLPIRLATATAHVAVRRKSIVVAYVVGVFIVAPLAVLLIS